jgi:hypothetical protein
MVPDQRYKVVILTTFQLGRGSKCCSGGESSSTGGGRESTITI